MALGRSPLVYIISFISLAYILIATGCTSRNYDKNPKITLFEMCQFSDEKEIGEIIEEHHKHFRRLIDKELMDIVRLKANQDLQEYDEHLPCLEKLLSIYGEVNNIKDLNLKAQLYKSWNQEKCLKKLQLDSVFIKLLGSAATADNDSTFDRLNDLRSGYDRINDSFYIAYLDYETGKRYYDKDNIEICRAFLERSRKIAEELDYFSLLGLIYNLSGRISYKYDANFSQAMQLYEESTGYFDAIDEHKNSISSLTGQAQILQQLNKYESAIRVFGRLGEAYRASNSSSGLSYCDYAIAESYIELKMYDSAMYYAEKALTAREKLAEKYDEKTADVGYSLSSLGILFQRMKEEDKALTYFNRADSIFTAIADPQGLNLNSVNKAYFFLETGDLGSAEEIFRNIIAGTEKYEEKEYAQYGLAMCAYNNGDFNRAEALFKECCRMIEAASENIPVGQAKFGSFSDKINSYKMLSQIAIQRYLETGPKQQLDSAINLAEQSKAITFDEFLANKSATQSDEVIRLKTRLSDLNRSLLSSPEKRKDLEMSIVNVVDSISILSLMTGENSSQMLRMYHSMEDITKYCRDKSLTVIEYIFTPADNYVIKYDRGGIEIKLLRINDDSLAVLASGLESCLSINPLVQDDRELYKRYCKALYPALFPDGLLKHIGNENLIIIPDGILGLIPFDCLIDHNNRFLTEYYRISYLPCLNLLFKKPVKPEIDPENSILVFANPQFKNPKDCMNGNPGAHYLSQMWYLNDLPYSSLEAENIQRIFGDSTAVVYSGYEATESAFKKENLLSFRYIHFAVHGLTNILTSDRGALVFSTPGDTENDGLLFPDEIYGLSLHCDLVFLSACNTGFGRLVAGEGIMNLAAPFIIAGSNSVIATFWSIDDKFTSEFVRNYYEHLHDGFDDKSALAESRRAFLQDKSGKYSHPYYWGAFLFLGK